MGGKITKYFVCFILFLVMPELFELKHSKNFNLNQASGMENINPNCPFLAKMLINRNKKLNEEALG